MLDLEEVLANHRTISDELIRQRCEESFLDFVELMWPALDPAQPFVRGKVQEAIALHLEAVTDGRIRNLLANVPPGSTKTYLVNVFWPAWEWGPRNRPGLRYMAWSYTPDLALQANDDCRKVIKHPVYQRFWGDRFALDGNSDAKGFFRNDRGGWRRSSSVGGASTGFRADRLIFDDPHNVKDIDSPAAMLDATRWFSRSLPTRVRNTSGESLKVKVPVWVSDVHGQLFDDPDDKRPVTAAASATIGIMQRVALHDISGIILKNPALGYEVLLIEMRYRGDEHPARALKEWPGSSIGYKDWRTEYGELADPVRFPEQEVARLEASLMLEGGDDAVEAQLQQWPKSAAGEWFKAEWLPIIEAHEVPIGIGPKQRGWDLGGGGKSSRADPTATAMLARGTDRKFYIFDSAQKRGGPPEVEAFIRSVHAGDPKSVDWSVPEDPGTGKLYANYIVSEVALGRYVRTSPEVKDKVTRAKPVSAQAKVGNVVIVRHPGCETLRSQMVEFPWGDHDDLVDAVSRAFASIVAKVEHGASMPPVGGSISDDDAPSWAGRQGEDQICY